MINQTTRQDVEDLLENFAEYVNPDGVHDPWFNLWEINQQFAWDDVEHTELTEWLDAMVGEEKVKTEEQEGDRVWAWQS